MQARWHQANDQAAMDAFTFLLDPGSSARYPRTGYHGSYPPTTRMSLPAVSLSGSRQ